MKNNNSLSVKKFFIVVITIFMLCGLSYAKPAKVDSKLLTGTWFWNFGYDQEKFANEQLTLNKDKTFEVFHIDPGYTEYDKGVYSIVNDKEHGPTIILNIKNFKNGENDPWQNVDVKMSYAIEILDNERLLMNRYKRDLSGMGYGIIYFDPSIQNSYTRIKDGTKEKLIGSWKVNPRGTPDCTWTETWVFNKDGTMEDYWSENGDKSFYKGSYEVITTKTGSVLHQIFNEESSDGHNYKKVNPPMEFWYDYKIDNENVINVNCTKNKISGVEHVYTPARQNFYYRDLPMETVTYHWANYTFTDCYPKGSDYNLLKPENYFFFTGVPDNLSFQNLEGWYDNPDQKGSLVKTISAKNDSGKREYWAKWGLKCNKNLYDPENGKYNHEFTLPLATLTPNMKLPKKGDTFTVILKGKMSDDIECYWGLRFVENNGWHVVGQDWHNIKTNGKTFYDTFEINVTEDINNPDLNNLVFNLCYNPDSLDKPITINDFSFEVIEGKLSSKKR